MSFYIDLATCTAGCIPSLEKSGGLRTRPLVKSGDAVPCMPATISLYIARKLLNIMVIKCIIL